jgi:GTPase-associated protein 1, N-terminal domain type 1
MLTDFDAFLTGYPLPATSFYALARTWAAPEMHRPGCVWTHTLLVERSEFGRVEIDQLLKLFARPQGDLEMYDVPRGVDVHPAWAHETPGVFDQDPRWVAPLLDAYYGAPNEPVFVVSDDQQHVEAAVRAILAQQWPRLRRRFSFSLAGAGIRYLGGKPFEVQLIAPRQLSFLRDHVKGGQLVTSPDDVRASPIWIRLATSDALTPHGEFREFLWRYGAESASPRTVFAPLTTLFSHLERPQQVDARNVVSLVSEPVMSRLKRLQHDLFEPDSILLTQPDAELLPAILFLRGALEPEAIAFESRVAALVREHPATVIQMLQASFEPPPNAFKQAVVDAVADAADEHLLITLTKSNPALVRRLVMLNPELATFPSLWRGPLAEELLGATASQGRPSRGLQRRVLDAVVSSAVDLLPEQIIAAWGPSAVAVSLDALNTRAIDTPIPKQWLSMISREAPAATAWLRQHRGEVSTALLRAFANALDPFEPELTTVPIESWRALALDSEDVRVNAFLFALATQSKGRSRFELMALAFSRLHAAATRKGIPSSVERVLEPVLPPSDEDLADRLRQAFILALLSDKSPPLPYTLVRADLLPALGRTAVRVGGKKLARELDLPAPEKKTRKRSA